MSTTLTSVATKIEKCFFADCIKSTKMIVNLWNIYLIQQIQASVSIVNINQVRQGRVPITQQVCCASNWKTVKPQNALSLLQIWLVDAVSCLKMFHISIWL